MKHLSYEFHSTEASTNLEWIPRDVVVDDVIGEVALVGAAAALEAGHLPIRGGDALRLPVQGWLPVHFRFRFF